MSKPVTLTDRQWGMVMSCDQNGFFPIRKDEHQDVDVLVAAGIMVRKGELTANLTPMGQMLVEAPGRDQTIEQAN